MSVYQNLETSGRPVKTDGLAPDSISGRHVIHACQQEPTRGNGSTTTQVVRVLGADGEHTEIPANPNPANRISGVSSQFQHIDNYLSIREGQKGTTGGNKTSEIITNLSKETCNVHKAVATSRAVKHAPLQYRALQRALNSVIPENNSLGYSDKYDSQITLISEMIRDLNWWSILDRQTMEAPICSSQPVIIIESDVSHQGWGARCGDTSTGRSWSIQEATQHINFLELSAAFLALKTFTTN